jgi:hypothetical protein
MMVGNGATNWQYDASPSYPDTVVNFNIAPKRYLNEYHQLGCIYYFENLDWKPVGPQPRCEELWLEFNKLAGDLNWYDLYRVNPLP